MITKPFTFTGNQLEVNFSTSAPGGIKLWLEDPSGTVLAESTELVGDVIARAVKWKNIDTLASLSGRTLRMRAQLIDADLYAIRFF